MKKNKDFKQDEAEERTDQCDSQNHTVMTKMICTEWQTYSTITLNQSTTTTIQEYKDWPEFSVLTTVSDTKPYWLY